MDDYDGFWIWGHGDGDESVLGDGFGSGASYWQGYVGGNGKGWGILEENLETLTIYAKIYREG